MNPIRIFTAGAAIGAGLLYLFDPERGARRRAQLRDQLEHTGREVEQAARTGSRRLRNRAAGVAHEIRAELTEGEVDDRVLAERVRSMVGHVTSRAGDVEVSATGGRVTLSGTVAPEELSEVVRTARAVRGVAEVENRLQPAGGEGDVVI